MSRIELGKSYPSLDRLVRIAEALDVSLQDMFEFNHLVNEGEMLNNIYEMLRELEEKDQRVIFKIVKAFQERRRKTNRD